MIFSIEATRRAFAAALFVALPCALSAGPLLAAPVELEANESFFVGTGGYTAGNLPGQGPDVGNAFTGNWILDTGSAANAQVLSSGLSYGDPLYASSGGAVQLSSDNAAQAFRRNLGSSATSSTTGVLYMSFLMERASQTADNGFQVLSLFDGSNRRFYVGTRHSNSNFVFHLESGGSITPLASVADNPGTNLFVVKFDFKSGNDDVTVWLNPELSEGPDPTGGVTGNGSLSFNRLVLQHGAAGGELTTTFDEIRFGDSWASVTAIPEPASASLLGTTLMLGLLCRRRR